MLSKGKTALLIILGLIAILCLTICITVVVLLNNTPKKKENQITIEKQEKVVNEEQPKISEEVNQPTNSIASGDSDIVTTIPETHMSEEDYAIALSILNSSIVENELDSIPIEIKDSIEILPETVVDIDGMRVFKYTLSHTDAVLVVNMYLDDNSLSVYGGICNRYGSDYGIVYFYSGVPLNSTNLYENLYSSDYEFSYWFATEYIEGDSTAIFKALPSGSVVGDIIIPIK